MRNWLWLTLAFGWACDDGGGAAGDPADVVSPQGGASGDDDAAPLVTGLARQVPQARHHRPRLLDGDEGAGQAHLGHGHLGRKRLGPLAQSR